MKERYRLIRARGARARGPGRHGRQQERYDRYLGYLVMLDPEGDEFCAFRVSSCRGGCFLIRDPAAQVVRAERAAASASKE